MSIDKTQYLPARPTGVGAAAYGTWTPPGVTDKSATHYAFYGIGGHRSIQKFSQLVDPNYVFDGLLEQGMLVSVVEDENIQAGDYAGNYTAGLYRFEGIDDTSELRVFSKVPASWFNDVYSKSEVDDIVDGITGGGSSLAQKQNINLDTPLTINSQQQTTVEGALGGLNTYLTSVAGQVTTLVGQADSYILKTSISTTLPEEGATNDTVPSTLAVVTAINGLKSQLSGVFHFKGTKATYEELPAEDNVIGDVWNVTAAHGNIPAGTNYAWDGTQWDALGGEVDLSSYLTISTAASTYVPLTRTINGVALSDNVTLTGTNLAVSGSDDTTIDVALTGKAAVDASNINPEQVQSWRTKLQVPDEVDLEPYVLKTTTINGQSLESNITLTGENINVSASEATSISSKLSTIDTNISGKAAIDASNLESENVTSWKSKLGIVQPDWNASTPETGQIANKPTITSSAVGASDVTYAKYNKIEYGSITASKVFEIPATSKNYILYLFDGNDTQCTKYNGNISTDIVLREVLAGDDLDVTLGVSTTGNTLTVTKGSSAGRSIGYRLELYTFQNQGSN